MSYRNIALLALVVVTLAVYWRTGNNGFVNYDDPVYVVQNAHIQELTVHNIAWAFTTTETGNWHPLTLLSLMADYQIYGLNPRGYHFTSIFLHVANTVCLFLLLAGLTGATWRSAFVAALFALHPLHVESVAWVAERKDVLSTLFFLLTLLAYARYVERPGSARYVPVFCLYALGLMAKPMLVTLPFVLLLLDYWPLGRLRTGQGGGEARDGAHWHVRDILLEKVPFFLLSALFCGIAYVAQKSAEALLPLNDFSLLQRVANALTAYEGYLWKMLWPRHLAVLYPLPENAPPFWHVVLAIFVLGVLSAVVVRHHRRHPYATMGWLWFLGTLVPVIGIVQVGFQAMADRYTYIPSIGLFVMISWSAAEFANRFRSGRIFVSAAAGLILILLSAATWRQLGYWHDSLTLFAHTLDVTHNNYIAHANMGDALDEKGRFEDAVFHYQEALRIKPRNAFVDEKLANELCKVGRLAEALAYYRKALELNPERAELHENLGVTLVQLGSIAEAEKHFREAIRLNPNFVDAYYNLGMTLAREGRLTEAVSSYSEALRLNPADAEIRSALEQAQAIGAARHATH